MLEDEPIFAGLVCPQCGAHSDPPSEAVHGEIRCPNCRAIILFATPTDSIPLAHHRISASGPPLPDPAIFTGIRPDATESAGSDDDALEFRVKPSDLPRPQAWYVPPPLPPEAALPTAEVDEQAAPLVREPLYKTFFSGVLTSAFCRSALGQFIVLSIFAIVCGVAGIIVFANFALDSRGGIIEGGLIGLPTLLILLFAVSYAADCVVHIAENAIYSHDDATGWPEPDWRDRGMSLIQLGTLVVLCAMAGAAVAAVLSLLGANYNLVLWFTVLLLFPVLFLSTLESNSAFWPVSPLIWRSFAAAWQGWLGFYVASGLLLLAWYVVAIVSLAKLDLLSPLISAPLLVVVIFTYARLLGRLAGYLMRHGRFLVVDEESV